MIPSAYLQGPVWHGHEMLFGYTTAIIAGFLLTAVRAWTNQPTPSGAPLMALAMLWVCGRVLVLTPLAMTAAAVNAAFPVAIALAIGIPLLRSRNVRNYFFVGLLVLMGMLILVVHLALQRRFDLSPLLGVQLALDVVLFIMVVMGGRVIPMLIQVAALVRVCGGIASQGLYTVSVQLSGLLWTAAFGLYAVRYWPVLTCPRLDGKPG